MSDQSLTLGHLISRFNAMRKRFIIGNLAIDTWPVIYANDEFNELLERRRSDVIGKSITNCELWLTNEHTIENQNDKWKQLKLHIKERREYQFQADLKLNGKYINCRILMAPIKNTELIVIVFEVKENPKDFVKKRRILSRLILGPTLNKPVNNQKTDFVTSSQKNYCDRSDRKLSIFSQLSVPKQDSEDGASLSRSKSLENTGMQMDKKVIALVEGQTNFSCGNLDHMAMSNDIQESENKLDDKSKKLNNKLRFRLCENESEIDSLRLQPYIMKKQAHQNLIKRAEIPLSKSMTHDLRTLHLQLIENEFERKLKNDALRKGNYARHNIRIQPEETMRKQSTGELLANSKNHAQSSGLAKSLNESLFESVETLPVTKHYDNIDHLVNNNENQSPRTNSSNSISSKNSISKSTKSTVSKCYSKTSSTSSSMAPFRLPFNNKVESEKRESFSSPDSSKGILKGVQTKLSNKLSNKVAQVGFFDFSLY